MNALLEGADPACFLTIGCAQLCSLNKRRDKKWQEDTEHALFDNLDSRRQLATQERLAVLAVAETHAELAPPTVGKHRHRPLAIDVIGELPKDMIAILVGKTLVVGLKYATGGVPDCFLHAAYNIPAAVLIRSVKDLYRVDRPH